MITQSQIDQYAYTLMHAFGIGKVEPLNKTSKRVRFRAYANQEICHTPMFGLSMSLQIDLYPRADGVMVYAKCHSRGHGLICQQELGTRVKAFIIAKTGKNDLNY